MADEIHLLLPDEAATVALAQRLAPLLVPGDLIALAGDLGTGKTAFARALIHALGADDDVPSPTFTLLQTYDTARGSLWHYDLYRITAPDELIELGWEEARSGIVLVEWPDRAGTLLPADRLEIRFAYGSAEGSRDATLCPEGAWAGRSELRAALQKPNQSQ